jgi:hypothetical protein
MPMCTVTMSMLWLLLLRVHTCGGQRFCTSRTKTTAAGSMMRMEDGSNFSRVPGHGMLQTGSSVR